MSVRDRNIMPSTFNRRISVKRVTTAIDIAGGVYNIDFTTRFTTFAYVEELSMTRKTIYGFDTFDSIFEIIIRYTPDRQFTVEDVIEYLDGTNVVTMQVIDPTTFVQGYKRYTVITCRVISPIA